MKVVGFNQLSKKGRQKKHIIMCTGCIFKPLVFVLGVAISVLVVNLLTGTFFANMHANLQNFVDSFVNLF